MTCPIAFSTSALRTSLRKTVLAGLLLCTLALLAGTTAQAQTFEVIHSFARVPLGFAPYAGLVQDARGDLYGTTDNGGGSGSGSVYKLTHGQSGWTMTALVVFRHDGNGYSPATRLTLGPTEPFTALPCSAAIPEAVADPAAERFSGSILGALDGPCFTDFRTNTRATGR